MTGGVGVAVRNAFGSSARPQFAFQTTAAVGDAAAPGLAGTRYTTAVGKLYHTHDDNLAELDMYLAERSWPGTDMNVHYQQRKPATTVEAVVRVSTIYGELTASRRCAFCLAAPACLISWLTPSRAASRCGSRWMVHDKE